MLINRCKICKLIRPLTKANATYRNTSYTSHRLFVPDKFPSNILFPCPVTQEFVRVPTVVGQFCCKQCFHIDSS